MKVSRKLVMASLIAFSFIPTLALADTWYVQMDVMWKFVWESGKIPQPMMYSAMSQTYPPYQGDVVMNRSANSNFVTMNLTIPALSETCILTGNISSDGNSAVGNSVCNVQDPKTGHKVSSSYPWTAQIVPDFSKSK
ncbi:MAG: hypothetical protein JSS53_05715 [Proteobacteria bacterium]|nr:hypothetical protein [Pseudomonadota bacterium]